MQNHSSYLPVVSSELMCVDKEQLVTTVVMIVSIQSDKVCVFILLLIMENPKRTNFQCFSLTNKITTECLKPAESSHSDTWGIISPFFKTQSMYTFCTFINITNFCHVFCFSVLLCRVCSSYNLHIGGKRQHELWTNRHQTKQAQRYICTLFKGNQVYLFGCVAQLT